MINKMLEGAGEARATTIKECLYPKCEECDKYHGQYCTVPMVVSKQIYLFLAEKIASMEQRLEWTEKAVTDEILGEKEHTPNNDVHINYTWDDYLKLKGETE